ncbi:MAG: metallophosphatase domain-containing protein [Chitinophagaceae bacterium]|nr:metallophosphatase domain-containing protein [Chitinophagaceae bacterium]
MKIIVISDTHGKHNQLRLPPGDMLIHAGDICMKGAGYEVDEFLHWFEQQSFRYKIFIAGNHDFYLEEAPEDYIRQKIPKDIIYLNDSGITTGSLNIWGSPVTPWFFDWAFNRHRGEAIKKHWDMIPGNTDILITHGPVFRILDETYDKRNVGCEDLLNRVHEVKPGVHICGHIHEAYGTVIKSGTRFVNASVLNSRYELANQPVVIEL